MHFPLPALTILLAAAPAPFQAKSLQFGGLRLDASIRDFEERYENTLCDVDPIDRHQRTIWFHAPAPCRSAAALPEGTIVLLFTKSSQPTDPLESVAGLETGQRRSEHFRSESAPRMLQRTRPSASPTSSSLSTGHSRTLFYGSTREGSTPSRGRAWQLVGSPGAWAKTPLVKNGEARLQTCCAPCNVQPTQTFSGRPMTCAAFKRRPTLFAASMRSSA